MDKLIKLMVLGFVVVGISACGKTGELTPVKKETQQAESAVMVEQAAVVESAVMVEPTVVIESDIMPHNSK